MSQKVGLENSSVATEPERRNSSNQKPSLQAYTLAEQVAREEISGEKNQTLKQYYINLMTQLEIEGFPKEQISTIGKQIVIEKKSEKLKTTPKEEIKIGSWWYDTAREQGYIDPHYSHGSTTDKKEILLNNFEEENENTIMVIDEMQDYLKTLKLTMRTKHFESLVPEKELQETLTITKNVIDHCSQRINDKVKISPVNYSILIRDSFYASGTALSQMYYLHVKEKEAFVKKQYQKVVRGIMQNMPARYEPNDEIQSQACGFSGVPCPKCDSYRTEFVPGVKTIEEINPKTKKTEKRTIGIRKIHCFKEDMDHVAPMPKLPAVEINEAEW